MAKTIAQKTLELAEENAAMLTRVSGLEAVNAQLVAEKQAEADKAAALQAEIDALKAKLAEKEGELDGLNKDKEEGDAEKEALKSEVQKLAATLALNPQVRQPEGTAPVAIDIEAEAAGQPATWAEALKACNGDYVSARKKFPNVHKEFLNKK